MSIRRNQIIVLQIFCITISLSFAQLAENLTIPILPTPRFSDNGDIEWGPRIVGGTLALFGEFRGQISVQTNRGAHFCGATLVTHSHVVTAAHCMYYEDQKERYILRKPNEIQLMGDDLSVSMSQSSPNRQTRSVSKIVVHPRYSHVTLENDVAVIRTSRNFTETASFNPIRWSQFRPSVNATCQVAGWGSDREGGPVVLQLMKINVPIIDSKVCNDSLISMTGDGIIRDGMMCAGYLEGGKDSCQGDSGGGLIHNNILAGIVSFGYGCARPNLPGAYTDVSRYSQWINETINSGRSIGSFSMSIIVLIYLLIKLI